MVIGWFSIDLGNKINLLYPLLILDLDHSKELFVDGDRIGICGNSAGGNLAAALILLAHDRNRPSLHLQLLISPVLDSGCSSDSHRLCGNRFFFLTSDFVKTSWKWYLKNFEKDSTNFYASPSFRKDLSGLPQTMIVSAECDPLYEEANLYCKRLKADGVLTTLLDVRGVEHGFEAILRYSISRKTWLEIGKWTRQAFGISPKIELDLFQQWTMIALNKNPSVHYGEREKLPGSLL